MKELTVDDIKKISIEILRDVHNFCVENNLHYSLAYGTLLGAVRHHGFIPWDDDIDIMMPRPDYDKFIHSYRSNKGFAVFAPELRNSYIAYARAADTVRTVVHSPTKWAPNEQGVWVDIFPVDGTEEDLVQLQNKTDKLKVLREKIFAERFRLSHKGDGLKGLMKYLFFSFTDRIFKEDVWNLLDKINQIRISVGYASSKRGIYELIYKSTTSLPAEFFDNYELVNFGTDKFMAIKDFDAFLSGVYGEYMKLPPKSQRVYKHSEHKYYWKL